MNIEVKNSIKPIDYAKSMKILEKRVHDVLFEKKEELLWILEHKTVYTSGTSADEKDLIDKNLLILKTNRGGRYTVHSPGQKVIYFVLNIVKSLSIKSFSFALVPAVYTVLCSKIHKNSSFFSRRTS